jgi:transposase
MGKRKGEQQGSLWIPTSELSESPGHPFYKRLNEILKENGFEEFVEEKCRRYYAERMGRPSLPPGVYFRMLLVGYFEGIDSERGIAWRCADSLSLREFLGYELTEKLSDHSTVSRTRRLFDLETHQEVFDWILGVLREAGLVKGKTIGVDATTLEANAALRSIVRRDTGETYEEFLVRLAKASGIETPTREDLAKLDRKRKRKGSNDDWEHPHDSGSAITKMKDGRTHLAHKAEHAVDMDTGAVLNVAVSGAEEGDTDSLPWTVIETTERLERVVPEQEASQESEPIRELVADKGYHSNDSLVDLVERGIRSYVSEPNRGKRNWKKKGRERDTVYANRRRIRGERGKRLLRKRGELLERAFAHYLDRGGMRRVHLRGRMNILKRLLIQVCAFNLGLMMRVQIGTGTPKGFRALSNAVQSFFDHLQIQFHQLFRFVYPSNSRISGNDRTKLSLCWAVPRNFIKQGFATGC